MRLDSLIFLARAIGDSVLRYFGSNVTLSKREFGGDLARLVDESAENTLNAFLDVLDESPDLLTEASGYVKRGGDGILVVDPVDGSVNADRGVPFFCVSIAYFEENDLESIKYAVIYDPIHRDTFYAERGRGARYTSVEMKTERLRPPKKPKLEIIYFSLSRFTTNEAERLMKFGIRLRELGSVALGMAYTASGRLDGFVDLRGIVRLTDIAAGYLILKEAGYAVRLKITNFTPIPQFSVIASSRPMIKALMSYLESRSEGFDNTSLRERRSRGDRNIAR